MKNKFASLTLGLLFLTNLGFAQFTNTKTGAQVFKGSITINAKADAIWNLLTDSKKIFGLAGYEYLNGQKTLTAIGDKARIKVWGDEGNLVITTIHKNKDLRQSWDPDNASYICQENYQLSEVGGKTILTYTNTYTESGPQSKADIQAQIKSLNSFLDKIKKTIEKK